MVFSPEAFAAYAGHDDPAAHLPVETWHPACCGAIDMVIRRDGRWFHDGTPILRPEMVRLFARLLRRDADGYVLVTPVEKVAITVEDAPFVAVEMTAEPGRLVFRTNVGDRVTADAAHPLRFRTLEDGGFVPYVRVRGGLDARLTPGLARDLAGLSEEVEGALGVTSSNCFFMFGGADPLFDPAGSSLFSAEVHRR